MPPAPQDESVPKTCLGKQDSSQALQIWKTNAPKTSGGRDPELVPAHALSQAEALSDAHVQTGEETHNSSSMCKWSWGLDFFPPTSILFNVWRHLFPLTIQTSIPLFDSELKNKNPRYVRHPGRPGHTAPEASQQLCAYRGSCIQVFSSLLVKSPAAATEGAALVQLHLENASKSEHLFFF